MGWFDDNHPMGQAAQDREDEMMEELGVVGKWQRDPPKASGSSSRAPKRVERPGAEWGMYTSKICIFSTPPDAEVPDSSKWRKSSYSTFYSL